MSLQRLVTSALLVFIVTLFVGLGEVHCEPVNVAKPVLIYGGLSAADLASTDWAIRNGAVEGNGFMASDRLAKQAAVASAFVAADVLLQKQGKPGHAKALRVTYAVLRVVAVGLNLHNARRGK